MGIGTVVAILASTGFDLHRLNPHATHEHYLSIAPTNDGYQAYPLFSTYHLVDLLNLFTLMAPCAIFLIGHVGARNRASLWNSDQNKLLLFAIGYKNLGNAYLSKGEVATAIPLYQRAIEINPQYANAYEHLAKAFENVGKHEQAITSYQQAARLGSPFAQQLLLSNGYSW